MPHVVLYCKYIRVNICHSKQGSRNTSNLIVKEAKDLVLQLAVAISNRHFCD